MLKRSYTERETLFTPENSRSNMTDTSLATTTAKEDENDVFIRLADAIKTAVTEQTGIPCQLVRCSPHGNITLQASTTKNVICPYRESTHDHNHTWFSIWLSYPLPTIHHRCHSLNCADQQVSREDLKKLVIDTDIFADVIRLTEEFYLSQPVVPSVIIPSLLIKKV